MMIAEAPARRRRPRAVRAGDPLGMTRRARVQPPQGLDGGDDGPIPRTARSRQTADRDIGESGVEARRRSDHARANDAPRRGPHPHRGRPPAPIRRPVLRRVRQPPSSDEVRSTRRRASMRVAEDEGRGVDDPRLGLFQSLQHLTGHEIQERRAADTPGRARAGWGCPAPRRRGRRRRPRAAVPARSARSCAVTATPSADGHADQDDDRGGTRAASGAGRPGRGEAD